MPMTGRSFEIASSTRRTDFLRPTSIGMIDPGKSTELRSGRTEMYSGISTGPSGAVFLGAIALIVIRGEPSRDIFWKPGTRTPIHTSLLGHPFAAVAARLLGAVEGLVGGLPQRVGGGGGARGPPGHHA